MREFLESALPATAATVGVEASARSTSPLVRFVRRRPRTFERRPTCRPPKLSLPSLLRSKVDSLPNNASSSSSIVHIETDLKEELRSRVCLHPLRNGTNRLTTGSRASRLFLTLQLYCALHE